MRLKFHTFETVPSFSKINIDTEVEKKTYIDIDFIGRVL